MFFKKDFGRLAVRLCICALLCIGVIAGTCSISGCGPIRDAIEAAKPETPRQVYAATETAFRNTVERASDARIAGLIDDDLHAALALRINQINTGLQLWNEALKAQDADRILREAALVKSLVQSLKDDVPPVPQAFLPATKTSAPAGKDEPAASP